MILSRLLDGVPVTKMFQTMYGQMVTTHEVEIASLQYDSRKVGRDDAFVAIRGINSDGNNFIPNAIHQGAKVVVTENDVAIADAFCMHAGVVKVVVPNSRKTLARMAANFYGTPASKLQLVGVTGTNGKTTTAFLLHALFARAGLIGTIEYHVGAEIEDATHTTPESLELNQLLARMVERNCEAAVMEVSSHSLEQHRIEGLAFDAAVFTNLTQDHLDYHGTMENYFQAKKNLFDGLGKDSVAVTNIDDPYGERIIENCKAQVVRYGFDQRAEVCAVDAVLNTSGTTMTVLHREDHTKIDSSLIGRFNVYNVLAAFAAGIGLGIPKEHIQFAISNVRGVRGRFERINVDAGWTAIVDYAHTPDALENCMKAVHDIFDSIPLQGKDRGRLITVFGCGGNRDRGKRPVMGRIATELGDITIVTSDNPRFEDPEIILDEIVQGAKAGSVVYREQDRRKAIELASELARPGDVVLIAGKGHETYQVVGDQKIPFSDREVLERITAASR